MSLNKLERMVVNLFTPYDFIRPNKYFRNIELSKSKGIDRWKYLVSKKIEWTDKVILEKEKNGNLSNETIRKQMETPCGYLRLMTAYFH